MEANCSILVHDLFNSVVEETGGVDTGCVGGSHMGTNSYLGNTPGSGNHHTNSTNMGNDTITTTATNAGNMTTGDQITVYTFGDPTDVTCCGMLYTSPVLKSMSDDEDTPQVDTNDLVKAIQEYINSETFLGDVTVLFKHEQKFFQVQLERLLRKQKI